MHLFSHKYTLWDDSKNFFFFSKVPKSSFFEKKRDKNSFFIWFAWEKSIIIIIIIKRFVLVIDTLNVIKPEWIHDSSKSRKDIYFFYIFKKLLQANNIKEMAPMNGMWIAKTNENENILPLTCFFYRKNIP